MDAPSERRNIRNSAPPRTRATRWRTPKITSSSASGDIAPWIPVPAGGRMTPFRYHRRPLVASISPCPRRPPQIMADSTKLSLTARDPEGSRSARRLRRTGDVPGVIYGGDGEPSHFAVDARILRNTLAHSGAILDVTIDGGKRRAGARQGPPAPPGARRDHARGLPPREHERDDPDDGRARARSAPTRPPASSRAACSPRRRASSTSRRCPGDIPDIDQHDVSGLEMNATLTLSAVTAPAGITLLDDPEETRRRHDHPADASSRSTTRSRPRPALVGEDGGGRGQAEGDAAEEAEQPRPTSSDES